MNLLIKESLLQVGLNTAILLRLLYFRLLISTTIRDGHNWVYRTYEEWKNEESPFWFVDTNKRAFCGLEDKGYIVAANSYNWMKMDKTKGFAFIIKSCNFRRWKLPHR